MNKRRPLVCALAFVALLSAACGGHTEVKGDNGIENGTTPPSTDIGGDEEVTGSSGIENGTTPPSANNGVDDAAATHPQAKPAAAREEPDKAKQTEVPEEPQQTSDDGRDSGSASLVSLPGQGVNVTMARASWNTGLFQAEVYKALLEELGYTVSDPSQAEMFPGNFYEELAGGDFDLWVNSWFPAHHRFLADELPDGSLVSNHVSVIGEQMLGGGLQGFVIDKTTGDAHGIVTMADIGDNPEIAALFDSDGNGKADLIGCNERWACSVTIDQTITRNGWEGTIEQVSGDYDALLWEAWEHHLQGNPILAYTWSPSAYAGELGPGVGVYWLTVPNPLPDQRGPATLPPEQCPGQPCELGFVANDILVTANNRFLAANRPAAILLELVAIPSTDLNRQILRMEAGENSQADITRHAHEWIESNRDTVDRWIAAASDPTSRPSATTAAETTTPTAPDTTTTVQADATTAAETTTPTAPDTTTTAQADPTTTASVRPGKFSDFNGADAATWQQMHADGQVVACHEGIVLPLDSFCLDENYRFTADYSQVLGASFVVIHLPDGDGLVLQGNARFRAGASIQLGWITFEKIGADRVITHLEP